MSSSNFINCLYYNELRKFIFNNYKIIDIIDCKDDKYLETEQDTIIFIIQNKDMNSSFSVDKKLFSFILCTN